MTDEREQHRRAFKFKFFGDEGADQVIEDLVDTVRVIGQQVGGRMGEDHLKRMIGIGRRFRDSDIGVERVDDGPPTELLIRGLEPEVARRFKTASGARAMKYADYLGALVKLHDEMRTLADSDPAVKAALDKLGLQTVTA